MGTIKTEGVCVSDGYRVGGVRLYKGEFLLGWRKIWSCGEIYIVVCCVTDIMVATAEHVSCCYR